MSSSTKIDSKGKDILILGLGEHSLSAEKMYPINFIKINTKFCLSLHYNGPNSFFVCLMVQKFINLQLKIL